LGRVVGETVLLGEGFESRNRSRARLRFVLRSLVGITLLLGIPVAGQFPQIPPTNGGRNGQVYPDSNSQFGEDSNSPEKKRIKLLNAERQKAIVSDTEKLLKLARELNDEVTATDPAAMSGAQLHKVEEIGKLAHSVREKMSFSVGGFPALTIQPPIQ